MIADVRSFDRLPHCDRVTECPGVCVCVCVCVSVCVSVCVCVLTHSATLTFPLSVHCQSLTATHRIEGIMELSEL